MLEPRAMKTSNDDIVLRIELWDDNAWKDEMIAHSHVSVLPAMQRHGKGAEAELQLTTPGDDAASATLLVKLKFEA